MGTVTFKFSDWNPTTLDGSDEIDGLCRDSLVSKEYGPLVEHDGRWKHPVHKNCLIEYIKTTGNMQCPSCYAKIDVSHIFSKLEKFRLSEREKFKEIKGFFFNLLSMAPIILFPTRGITAMVGTLAVNGINSIDRIDTEFKVIRAAVVIAGVALIATEGADLESVALVLGGAMNSLRLQRNLGNQVALNVLALIAIAVKAAPGGVLQIVGAANSCVGGSVLGSVLTTAVSKTAEKIGKSATASLLVMGLAGAIAYMNWYS